MHPDLPFSWYLDMLNTLKREAPHLHIKAFTAVEIDISRSSRQTVKDTLLALREAGLGSLPGGGAEIFNPGVRNTLCAEKICGERWLDIMETAHGLGMKSNATMLYGHIETVEDRVDHLLKLRELQDRTGGFQAFIPLASQPRHSDLARGASTTGFDDLRTLAVGRLFLDNFDT